MAELPAAEASAPLPPMEPASSAAPMPGWVTRSGAPVSAGVASSHSLALKAHASTSVLGASAGLDRSGHWQAVSFDFQHIQSIGDLKDCLSCRMPPKLGANKVPTKKR